MTEPVRQRRGDELRRHILMTAKEVFLEQGYERASMDAVASRAGTSKRSLYAHFDSKDALFRAAVDLIRELYLDRLQTPEVYADRPREAVARFCGRFLQLVLWEPQVRTCRLSIAESERRPAVGGAYFDAIFGHATDRLAAYLVGQDIPKARAAGTARDLIARTVLPSLMRALLAVDAPITHDPSERMLAGDVDLPAIRRVVRSALPELS